MYLPLYPQPRPTSCTLYLNALVSRHYINKSRPLRTPSARQPARYAIVHSTKNETILPLISHRDLLDTGLTCSLFLSPSMIQSNLSLSPTFPTTFWDLVPFLGDLALIFTVLLALLTEDDPIDGKVLGEEQSQLPRYQRRFVSQSEKDCVRSQWSYYGYPPVQRKVTIAPPSVTVTALPSHVARPMSWPCLRTSS
jgi:hypothetical protein